MNQEQPEIIPISFSIVDIATTPPHSDDDNTDSSSEYETDSNQSDGDDQENPVYMMYYHTDQYFDNNFNMISKNIGMDNYYEKVDNLRLSKHIHFMKKIMDNIFSFYSNSIIFGDIISTLYMYDKLIDTELNSINLKFTQIYVLHDTKTNIESIVGKLSTFVCINYHYTIENKSIIYFTVKDDNGYIYNIYIHIHHIPSLYCNLLKSNSPYLNKEPVELNLVNQDMKDLYFLNRFKHHRMGKILNNWSYDYVILENINNKIFLNVLENSDVENCVINKKLEYIKSKDVSMINPYKELEIFFNNIQFTKNNVIFSRINMFIHTNIMLFFVQKGWTFEQNIKKVKFDEECFICCNKASDFSVFHHEMDIYKISINCCKEAIDGICVKCFIKNAMECYKNLKSSYICPFCKKEHYFYHKDINHYLLSKK